MHGGLPAAGSQGTQSPLPWFQRVQRFHRLPACQWCPLLLAVKRAGGAAASWLLLTLLLSMQPRASQHDPAACPLPGCVPAWPVAQVNKAFRFIAKHGHKTKVMASNIRTREDVLGLLG